METIEMQHDYHRMKLDKAWLQQEERYMLANFFCVSWDRM